MEEEEGGEEGEHRRHRSVCYPEILHDFEARVNAVLCLKCLCERQHLFFSSFELFMKVCFAFLFFLGGGFPIKYSVLHQLLI